MVQEKKREVLGGILLLVALVALDQYTKYHITSNYDLGQSVGIFSWLNFTYVQNTGALWSIAQGQNLLFIIISFVVYGLLYHYRREFGTAMEKLSLVFMLSGITGNLLDRLFRGFVVDFLDLGWWPVFNIADSALVVGIALYFLEQIRKWRLAASKKDRQRSRNR